MKKKFEEIFLKKSFNRNDNKNIIKNTSLFFYNSLFLEFNNLKIFIKKNFEVFVLLCSLFLVIIFSILTNSFLTDLNLIIFSIFAIILSINYASLKKAFDSFDENEFF